MTGRFMKIADIFMVATERAPTMGLSHVLRQDGSYFMKKRSEQVETCSNRRARLPP